MPSARPRALVAGLPVGVPVHDIGVDVDAGAGGRAGFQVDWEGWNSVSYTERVKTGCSRSSTPSSPSPADAGEGRCGGPTRD